MRHSNTMWHVDANNENKYRGKEAEGSSLPSHYQNQQVILNQKHALQIKRGSLPEQMMYIPNKINWKSKGGDVKTTD